jgi:hypothetical protein
LSNPYTRLSEAWPNYTAFYTAPDIPWINNLTEQAIDHMKLVLSLSKACAPARCGLQDLAGHQAGLM